MSIQNEINECVWMTEIEPQLDRYHEFNDMCHEVKEEVEEKWKSSALVECSQYVGL